MNKKQKRVLGAAVLIIVLVTVFWIIQGTEVFTKSQVLVDNTSELDRMLGIENKQFMDKFILGFLPSGLSFTIEFLSVVTISGFIIVLSGILIYSFRNKRKVTL
jgi:hypothetical protein